MRYLFFTLIVAVLCISCRQQGLDDNCILLKTGISRNESARVSAAIDGIIATLSNKNYTEANLDALVQKIASGCQVSAGKIGFDIIKTNPTQSEIRITFSSAGTTHSRIIDISYDATNRMVFRGMHE